MEKSAACVHVVAMNWISTGNRRRFSHSGSNYKRRGTCADYASWRMCEVLNNIELWKYGEAL